MSEAAQPSLGRIPTTKLLFDPENPRFGGEHRGKSQPEIQKAIFGPPHYASELVDSLIENGFIDYEPLVAKRHQDSYVVIEGNRRLAAIKEILENPVKYKNRKSDLKEVPVIIFPDKQDDNDRDDVRVYLGVRHLLGFREWPPLAKAEFLEKESQKAGGLERVIKEVRITRQQVRRFLIPHRLMKEAKVKLPEGEDFWVLGEALQRAGVKKFLQLDVDSTTLQIVNYDKGNLKLLLDDLYGPRDASVKHRDVSARKIHDTRDLSTYASVLSSNKAAAVLHSGKGLTEAAIYVDTREQSQTRISKIVRDLNLLIRKLMQQERTPEAIVVKQAFKDLEAAVKSYLKANVKSDI